MPTFLHIHSRQSKRNKSSFCLMLWKMLTWISQEYTDITALEMQSFLLLYGSHGLLAIFIWSILDLTCSWILGPALIFLIKCFPVIVVEVSLPYSCVPTRSLAQLGHPSVTATPWHMHRPKSLSSTRRFQKPHLYADDNKHIKPLQLIKIWQLSPNSCLQAKGCNDKSPSWIPINQENFNHLF